MMNHRLCILSAKIARYLAVYPHEVWRLHKLLEALQLWPSYFDNRALLKELYQHLIAAEPDTDAQNFYLPLLNSGQVSAYDLLFSFLMIPASIEQAVFGTTGIHSHHQARIQLVKEHLPSAQKILDLGGASPASPEGALLAMGYPHRPEQIDIVDFPPEKRLFHPPQVPQRQYLETEQGTKIRYFYRSFGELNDFPDATYDLIWAGQSIEHISPREAEKVLQAAKRLLKPGGWLCLDTPNRSLTRLLVHYGYVHPEHKIEYVPDVLIRMLQQSGFQVLQALSVSPLPLSLAAGRFSRLELIHAQGLGFNPDDGFSFYLAAQRA